jgi:hypothetical protein
VLFSKDADALKNVIVVLVGASGQRRRVVSSRMVLARMHQRTQYGTRTLYRDFFSVTEAMIRCAQSMSVGAQASIRLIQMIG